MLTNLVVFGSSSLLAASCFVVPRLIKCEQRPMRVMLVAALYVAVFAVFRICYDANTAIAITVLGLVFAALMALLVINFKIVHSAIYPKHHRCY